METRVCPVCDEELADGTPECPSCGFRISQTTKNFKPVNLEGDEIPQVSRAIVQPSLKIVRGPKTGTWIELKPDYQHTVGRNPACDIFLNDMTVSRAHALIDTQSGKTVITDTNSYNGVWVNNQNVEKRILAPGDIIQIGAFCLLYREQ